MENSTKVNQTEISVMNTTTTTTAAPEPETNHSHGLEFTFDEATYLYIIIIGIVLAITGGFYLWHKKLQSGVNRELAIWRQDESMRGS